MLKVANICTLLHSYLTQVTLLTNYDSQSFNAYSQARDKTINAQIKTESANVIGAQFDILLYLRAGIGAMQGKSRHLIFTTIPYTGGSATPLETKNKKYYHFTAAATVGLNLMFDIHTYMNLGISYVNLGNMVLAINQSTEQNPNYQKTKIGVLAPLLLTAEVGYRF